MMMMKEKKNSPSARPSLIHRHLVVSPRIREARGSDNAPRSRTLYILGVREETGVVLLAARGAFAVHLDGVVDGVGEVEFDGGVGDGEVGGRGVGDFRGVLGREEVEGRAVGGVVAR